MSKGHKIMIILVIKKILILYSYVHYNHMDQCCGFCCQMNITEKKGAKKKMRSYFSDIQIQGVKITGDNPLPVFRDPERDKPSRGNGTLRPEEEKFLGQNTGYRVLPYRIIDKYNRDKSQISLKTAVLENDRLTAVFLPEQGGRLWSLKRKDTGKEIIYTNPVFQPANLGIRNAWFSGGVEWNCSQYGHAVYSSSPVFFAKVTADTGEEFLRMYEFERMKRLFIQIDFHLPDGAETIYAHVTLYNQDDRQHSTYWWSNIAVKATEKLRVFSGTQDVIYMDPDSISDNKNPVRVFGRAELPVLPTLPGKDSTYPANAAYSNEYFFQNPEDDSACWSAAAYEDGQLFFEASTLPLRFRKMFCWGTHKGGKRWCEYLADEKEGNYVELQAGLTPTQLNAIYIPANTSWSFTQAIGETAISEDASVVFGEYSQARTAVCKAVKNVMPDEQLKMLDIEFAKQAVLPVGEILVSGSGWGALEKLRGGSIPPGMRFEESALTEEQDAWLQLLRQGFISETDVKKAPPSWMVDEHFLPLLKKSLDLPGGDHYLSRLHLGVMLYELGKQKEAVEEWKKSMEFRPSPFTLRNLAFDARSRGETERAVSLMKEAVSLENYSIDKAFSEELMDLFLAAGQYEQAWNFYLELPKEYQEQDLLSLQAGTANVELEHPDFAFIEALFVKEIACIREGDNTLTDLFFRYHVRRVMMDPKNKMSFEDAGRYVKENCIPPRHIDFRMVVK